ncbi:MAG: hypothetical protein K0Q72_4815, partial [Armatimonadetes bacterium]|nr:hypothetical protein [Armatimonadota bacterium]
MRLFPLRSRLGFHWFQDVGFWLLLAVAGGGALQAGAVPPGPRAEHAGIARPGVTRSFGTAKVRPLSKKE